MSANHFNVQANGRNRFLPVHNLRAHSMCFQSHSKDTQECRRIVLADQQNRFLARDLRVKYVLMLVSNLARSACWQAHSRRRVGSVALLAALESADRDPACTPGY